MEIWAKVKRFYKQAAAVEADGAWRVELDGRPIRTALGNAQRVPTRALAEALASEWAGQGDELDPAAFFFRDLTDYAIDVVAKDPAAIISSILPYGETDTLCYRADPDEPFFPRQLEVWEPLLCALEHRLGTPMRRVSGIMHRPQPVETLEALRRQIEGLDPFTLAALNTLTTLATSITIGLAALDDGADAKLLWDAASLEEDWQAEQWGQDWMAQERREKRFADFSRAMRYTRLVRS